MQSQNPRIQRFVVGSDVADKFDVLEGRRLNDKPLSRAEAYGLAGQKAWQGHGGSSGFSWNGGLASGRKP
jgi:hypothetical protein